jgi:hypothetical protein
MKPKPFSELNHFTVPCAMLYSSYSYQRGERTRWGRSKR